MIKIQISVLIGLALLLVGRPCPGAEEPQGGTNLAAQSVAFDVYWPPRDPEAKTPARQKPLLAGEVRARTVDLADGARVLKVEALLARPSDEPGRAFWNASLAYPQYSWMSAVRVWDADHRWLWPNLTYLLRVYGAQRVGRYGGWDPGKQVDNDFAAVLIRLYDDAGTQESLVTKTDPLVSAEWHAEGATNAGPHTVVHRARSDEFTVHLGDRRHSQSGQLRIWLIYADFLGAPVPARWPKQPEFNGGILAFFQLDWTHSPGQPGQIRLSRKVPPESTRFDWKEWLNRPTAEAEVEAIPRLTDR